MVVARGTARPRKTYASARCRSPSAAPPYPFPTAFDGANADLSLLDLVDMVAEPMHHRDDAGPGERGVPSSVRVSGRSGAPP